MDTKLDYMGYAADMARELAAQKLEKEPVKSEDMGLAVSGFEDVLKAACQQKVDQDDMLRLFIQLANKYSETLLKAENLELELRQTRLALAECEADYNKLDAYCDELTRDNERKIDPDDLEDQFGLIDPFNKWNH